MKIETGTPPETGVYVCYLPGLDVPTVLRTFITETGWCNNLREKVSGPVAGWIGPLPMFCENSLDARVKAAMEFDL